LKAVAAESSTAAVAAPDGRRLFLSALLVATAVPFVLFPLSTVLLPDRMLLDRTNGLLLFVGSSGHVAASFFFYTEPRMRSHMLHSYRTRFLVAPLVLVAGMTAIGFLLGGDPRIAYLVLFYWIWQTHHYNRQNHGILAFVSRAERQPVRDRDRLAITLTGVAAVLGMVTLVTPWHATFLQRFGWHLEVTSLGVFVCAWLVYLPSLLRDDPRATPWRSATLLALMLFYVPLFLFDDPFTGVMTYAIAHGLQYLVFMGFVVREPATARRGAVASLLAWTLLGGLVLYLSGRQQLWGSFGTAVYGAGLAVVMWHFLLDAGVWRLSQPFQRRYMAERFRFL
jgi:hypothetical protein